MRIISKFRDYYDTAMAHGQDKTVVFSRKQDEQHSLHRDYIPTRLHPFIPSYEISQVDNRKSERFSISPFVIIFCGKAYPGIHVEDITPSYRRRRKEISEHVYSTNEYQSLLERLGIRFKTEKNTWFNDNNLLQKDTAKDFFSKYSEKSYLEDFASHKQPIVAIDRIGCLSGRYKLTNNPCLKDYAFYRLFDAFSAFQELSMFVGGVMAQEGNSMANISDRDMAKAKGFNCYSFKKPPSKRKAKTCA